MANLKVSEQAYPTTRYTEAAAPATPAAGEVVIYAKADGNLYQKDDAGTETLLANAASGAVGTDAIWDAKGDLAGGTGANTAAKVTVGANGTVLTADSAQSTGMKWALPTLNSGTSNPGSPADGDLFYRTDLDLLIRYRSTGTRWVTVQQYMAPIFMQPVVIPLSATNSFYGALPNASQDLWLETIHCSTQVQTTNNGTNFWTIAFLRQGTSLGSFSTGTTPDTATTPTRHDVTVNALSGTSSIFLEMTMTKTLTPGTLYVFGALVQYRKVIT